MQNVPISVTDAARNFADCVNRARYQGTTFILHKNGVPVARIAPADETKQSKKRETEPEVAKAVSDAIVEPAKESNVPVPSFAPPARSVW